MDNIKYKDSEILGEIPKRAKELVQKLSINVEVLRKNKELRIKESD
jgi:hypothetical protein